MGFILKAKFEDLCWDEFKAPSPFECHALIHDDATQEHRMEPTGNRNWINCDNLVLTFLFFITFFWSILQSYKWMVLHLFLFLFSFYWCPSTGDMPQYWSVTACMGKNVGNVPYTLWVYTGNTTGVCCLSTNENYFMQMKTTGFACCSLQKLNYCS